MYKKAFSSFEMGYGAAVASRLFIVVLVTALTVYFPLQRQRGGHRRMKTKTSAKTIVILLLALLWLLVALYPAGSWC